MIGAYDYKERLRRAQIVLLCVGFYGSFLTVLLICNKDMTKIKAILFALATTILFSLFQYLMHRGQGNPKKIE